MRLPWSLATDNASGGVSMSPLLEVGRIGRSHGIRGDVLIKAISNLEERFLPGSKLVLVTTKLQREVTLERSAPYQGRYLAHISGIDTKEAAEEIRGASLMAEASPDSGDLFVHELIGSTVVDAEELQRGVVVSVEANPASDLLVLESGYVVPLVFVTGFDSEQRIIYVETPEGLFDL